MCERVRKEYEEIAKIEGRDVRIRVFITDDDVSPEVNLGDFGNEESDRAAYNDMVAKIRERMEDGDLWAWCMVEVRGELCIGPATLEEVARLGGCSYKDADDFIKNSGYYADMKKEILHGLEAQLVDLKEAL